MAEPWIISDASIGPYIQRDDQRRAELLDWCRANGIEPNDVPASSTLSVESTNPEGGQLIRHTAYLRNANGHFYEDPANPDEAAQEERTVPLAVEPPAHWRPTPLGETWCPCGHVIGDEERCLNGFVYGRCSSGQCPGVCTDTGTCTSPDCRCKESADG